MAQQAAGRLSGAGTDFKDVWPRWQQCEEVVEERRRVSRPNAVVDVGHPVEGLPSFITTTVHTFSLAHPSRAITA
jgi:hypothetical protein